MNIHIFQELLNVRETILKVQILSFQYILLETIKKIPWPQIIF